MSYEKATRCASDYAGFGVGGISFYYGYEETSPDNVGNETWAFVATKHGKEVFRRGIRPEDVDWDCNRGLLAGIAYYLESQQQRPAVAEREV